MNTDIQIIRQIDRLAASRDHEKNNKIEMLYRIRNNCESFIKAFQGASQDDSKMTFTSRVDPGFTRNMDPQTSDEADQSDMSASEELDRFASKDARITRPEDFEITKSESNDLISRDLQRHLYKSPVQSPEYVLNAISCLNEYGRLKIGEKAYCELCQHPETGDKMYRLVLETPESSKRLFAMLLEVDAFHEFQYYDSSSIPPEPKK